jgi:cation:H+ antiporter
MKTIKSHLLCTIFFLIIILFFGLVEKTLLSIALYSVLIVFGALLIAWGAESSEIIISEGLALALVALLQVFPEFMIEATISWAQDIPNMLSNFTGANRILTGVGWPLVFFTASMFYKKKHGKFLKQITLKNEHSAEIIFFLIATIYSIIIFIRGYLSIIDSVVMICLYISYLFFVSKLPHLSRKKTRKLLMGIPKKITSLKKPYIKPAILLMFLSGGLLVYFATEPFYNNAMLLAATLGFSQFLFIQWIAPFLTEFPEKTSAFYWASKVKQAPMALMNLISSKLTQWTLLLAMIPLIFSLSVGSISLIPLSSSLQGTSFTVSTEFLLTIATSLYASIILLKLRFTWFEAASLFVLWVAQFIIVEIRPFIIWVYVFLAILEIFIYQKEITKAFSGFRHILTVHVRK